MSQPSLSADAWRSHWKACWHAHQHGAFIRPADRDALQHELRALEAIGAAHRWRVWRRGIVLALMAPLPLVAAAAHWHWTAANVGWATLVVGLASMPWMMAGSDCWGTPKVRSRRQDLERVPRSRLHPLAGSNLDAKLAERLASSCGLLEGDLREAAHDRVQHTSGRSRYVPAHGSRSPAPPRQP